MSKISVVHYNNSNKINILQQNNVNNKLNDRQVIVIRRTSPTPPQLSVLDNDNILITNLARKKVKTTKESKINSQPVAVARRNARERNRVKQVNNGFATLRQHIPNFIAASFENSNGRGGNKKLSKVETLRMAVEYIRSLEDILTTNIGSSEMNEHISQLPYLSPRSSISPEHRHHNNVSYSYQVLSPPTEDEDISIGSSKQFIKMNDSTTYHIVSHHYVNENGENLDPLMNENLLNPGLELNVNSQDLSYLDNLQGTSSPGLCSEDSLSTHSGEKTDQGTFIPILNQDMFPHHADLITKVEHDLPVLSVKTESDLPDEHKENLVDVLQWWEQQPPSIKG